MIKRERKKTEISEKEVQEPVFDHQKAAETIAIKLDDQIMATINEEVVTETPTTNETITVEEPVTPKPGRWRKVGKGSFRWKNQIIKPNQVFEAYRHEIPKAFFDSLEELEPEVKGEALPEIKKTTFTIVPNGEYWDIVDSAGRVLNENPLEEEEAESILKELL